MTDKSLHLLDCSLRDGGYYNNWDFDLDTVRRYIAAMTAAGIEVVEIGFRFLSKDVFLGNFAYTPDSLLQDVWPEGGPLLAVMLNASDLVGFEGGPAAAIDRLFVRKSLSRVGLVRIAAHLREVDATEAAVQRLKELGYRVGFNLMQVAGKPLPELTDIARRVAAWNAVEVLYFADSLGAMEERDVRQVVEALAAGWSGPLGIHTHDNCQRALANTFAAFEAGASWLDATVLGIGRGAGNARMEYLVSELSRRLGKYRPAALYPLVMEDFQALWDKYRWGSNLIYYLSAQYGVHPTYSQQMLDSGRYTTEQILGALDVLRESGGASYSKSNLQRALSGASVSSEGTYDATGWATGRDVLIVAAGPSVARHREGLIGFINRHGPLVLSLNVNRVLPAELITAYVACHQARVMIEAHEYRKLDRLLIAPAASIPAAVQGQLVDVRMLDYGLSLSPDSFQINPKGCVLPVVLAAPYALAFVTAAGARRVFLAGFDGYGAGDPRQTEMVQVLETYQNLPNKLAVTALTPTPYPVRQSSLYAPYP